MSLSFALSEEQEMLRELSHEFARDVTRPTAERRNKTGEFPHEVWGTPPLPQKGGGPSASSWPRTRPSTS